MFRGDLLRECRLKSEKTQEDMARYLGISAGSYAHYEALRRKPARDTVKKLSAYFSVDEGFFYGEEIKVDKVRQLIDELIDKKIINDPNKISEDVVDMIMDAVKMEVRLKRIEKEQGM